MLQSGSVEWQFRAGTPPGLVLILALTICLIFLHPQGLSNWASEYSLTSQSTYSVTDHSGIFEDKSFQTINCICTDNQRLHVSDFCYKHTTQPLTVAFDPVVSHAAFSILSLDQIMSKLHTHHFHGHFPDEPGLSPVSIQTHAMHARPCIRKSMQAK